MAKIILSICDYSGQWARPYLEHGYCVMLVDPKHGEKPFESRCKEPGQGHLWKYGMTAAEFRDQKLESLGPIHGLLMAPPCTHFTISGAKHWAAKDEDGRTEEGIQIVRDCLDIKNHLLPGLKWWALENPVGRLNELVPELQPYGPWYFQPNDYGHDYTKKTGLWGTYTPPLPLMIGADQWAEPTQGSKLWAKLCGPSERTKELRSETPEKFARAFFTANP